MVMEDKVAYLIKIGTTQVDVRMVLASFDDMLNNIESNLAWPSQHLRALLEITDKVRGSTGSEIYCRKFVLSTYQI